MRQNLRNFSLFLMSIFFFSLALAACTSVPPGVTEAATKKLDAIPELKDLVSSPSPQTAFPRILYYRENHLLPAEKLTAFQKEGISALQQKLTNAISDDEYQKAAAYLQSLDTLHSLGILGSPPPHNLSIDALELKRAEKYLADGNDPAALDVFLGIDKLSAVASAKQLVRFGTIAVTYHNHAGVERIAKLLSEKKEKIPASFTEFLDNPPSATEMLKGTVTIWVNEGIKMQDGLGYANIIIGSGFFIDKRGYLITNYHVIAGMEEPPTSEYARMYIVLAGHPNDHIPAHVVGYSKLFDIALLKADTKPSYLFSFSRRKSIAQGDAVMAMGSPGGLDNTVTSGIVSATDRQLQQMGNVMQIDVPVNPGNSGGPLLTDKGDLVGVIVAGIPSFQGVNFAISSYWISKFLPRLYSGKAVPQPWIGVAVAETPSGLQVTYVAPKSPAAEIGLKEHDVITAIDGKRVTKIAEVQSQLLSLPPESLISLDWTRSGISMHGLVVPADRPFNPVEPVLKAKSFTKLFPLLYGMDVKTQPGFMRKDYVITEVLPGSTADETGLSQNDLFALLGSDFNPKKKEFTVRLLIQTKKVGFPQRAIGLTVPTEIPNFI